MIQYLFKKYEAFLTTKNSSPLQALHFWYKRKPACVYMAKTLRGNPLQDKKTKCILVEYFFNQKQ